MLLSRCALPWRSRSALDITTITAVVISPAGSASSIARRIVVDLKYALLDRQFDMITRNLCNATLSRHSCGEYLPAPRPDAWCCCWRTCDLLQRTSFKREERFHKRPKSFRDQIVQWCLLIRFGQLFHMGAQRLRLRTLAPVANINLGWSRGDTKKLSRSYARVPIFLVSNV